MEHTPIVSVIIPVYNAEKYLRECLDSVLNQTLKEIEVICVDDGSVDASPEILDEYKKKDSRLTVCRQENRGAGAARNHGMQYASGEYLFFMDSDDYCTDDFMETVTMYAREKSADIVVFDYYKINEEEGTRELMPGAMKHRCPKDKEVFSYRDVPRDICLTVIPTPWTKLYLHSFVKSTKLLWLETKTTNDITFATMSVLMADRIAYLEKPFMNYRVSVKNSITSRKKFGQENVKKAVLAIAEQAERLPQYEVVEGSVREFVASQLYIALERYTPDACSYHHLAFSEEIDRIVYSHPLFRGFSEHDFTIKTLPAKIQESRSRMWRKKALPQHVKLIVSLTSFPERIEKVYIAVNSIYKQTMQPWKVILWLAESQFPNKEADLPENLLEYRSRGLEIRWCKEDLRPHKKYFYAMQEFPEDLIVTIDDDLTYDKYMLETLFTSYLRFPNAVSAVRTHLVTGNEKGEICQYADWIMEFEGVISVPSMQLFSTSGAGTLYPPHCMDEEVFNVENIKKLSLNADDLWLKIMQVKKGTPVVLCQLYKKLQYIPGTQEIALQKSNVGKKGNDTQLQDILSVYDTDGWIAKEILKEQYTAETLAYGEDVLQENNIGALAGEPAYVSIVKKLERVSKAQKDTDAELKRTERAAKQYKTEAEKNAKKLKSELDRTSKKLERTSVELTNIKNSKAYRLGNAVAKVPRKIKNGIRYCRNHGLKATVHRIFVKKN